MYRLHEVTREKALAHFDAVRKMGLTSIEDPTEYFIAQVRLLKERIAKEKQMDPSSEEFKAAKGESHKDSTRAEYFRWLEGVFFHQLCYLFELEHGQPAVLKASAT